MSQTYRFLPFRFDRIGDKFLLVNDVGEYHFLDKPEFECFVNRDLDIQSTQFLNLKSKSMVYTDYLPQIIESLAIKYRTKKRFLYTFTSLHMFVVTQRCNQQCDYCHASSVDINAGTNFDMSPETARRCVDMAFMTPSPFIKIEFQGGEPLLNFEVVKEIVEYAEEVNQVAKKQLEFVICTNLVGLNQTILDYIKSKDILISTSLDGPQGIHDSCRKLRSGEGSYNLVSPHLSWAIEVLGSEKVSSLMTVTPYNLNRLCEVVDEYLVQGLRSIFLRIINRFGSAQRNWSALGYGVHSFLEAYKEVLPYIIQINLHGTHFPEILASLLLTRILTPFSTGFVDLQSPAGVGISGVIYDINGDVYPSDEARMLAKTSGDKKFYLGNVHKNFWHEIFSGPFLRNVVESSCIESLPGCAWCVFQPYCGGDPVQNYAIAGDMIGNRKSSDFCIKHRYLFNLLFNYLEKNDNDVEDIFWSWITQRTLDEIRKPNLLSYCNEIVSG